MTNHKTVDYCSITLHHIAKECKVQLQNTQVSTYDKRILKLIKQQAEYCLQQIEEHRRVRNLVKDEFWISDPDGFVKLGCNKNE